MMASIFDTTNSGFGTSIFGANPVSQFIAPRRNALMGLSAGFLSGDPGAAMRGAMQGQQVDLQYAQMAQEEQQQEQAKNQTIEWLTSQGYDDLAQMAQATGDIGGAWSEGIRRSQPQAGLEPTANMQDYNFLVGQGIDPNQALTSIYGGTGTQAPDAPTGYQWTQGEDGSPALTFIPGGPQDPANRSSSVPMNSTIQREIFEADDAVAAGQSVVNSLNRALELNNQAYDGPFSEQRAYGTALFGDQGGQATLELKNVVTAQALDSLKAIFGGMPTEGERKILLEIQGSVDQPRAVRDQIYRRAMDAANRRIAINQRNAGALRSGTYFEPGFEAGAPIGATPNTTSTGVQWSIEP